MRTVELKGSSRTGDGRAETCKLTAAGTKGSFDVLEIKIRPSALGLGGIVPAGAGVQTEQHSRHPTANVAQTQTPPHPGMDLSPASQKVGPGKVRCIQRGLFPKARDKAREECVCGGCL